MAETILVPGARDVRGTLDSATGEANTIVVACPPHPQQRGHRGDERLVAVSDELNDHGIDCLRFDYGDWDEGRGEKADTMRAVEWANERYDHVGLFGFSFGSAMALLAAADGVEIEAVSALAPPATIGDGLDVVGAFERIPVPVQVVYGTRDDIANWEPVVELAREFHQPVVEFSADHFFIGQTRKVAEKVGEFLRANVGV